MGLHESIGAMVGAGIGAMRSALDAERTEAFLDDVAGVLASRPRDLAGTLTARRPDLTDVVLEGASAGVSSLSAWERLALTRHAPVADRDLVRRAVLASTGERAADGTGWPASARLVPYYEHRFTPRGLVVPLPRDPEVLVGDVAGLADVDVDAVISLCRMGTDDVPDGIEHQEVWLVDDDPTSNPNLAFVLGDVAATIGKLRDEGKRVFVHCVRAESRTPAASASYLALRFSLSGNQALAITDELIPGPGPRASFRSALREIYPTG